MDDAHGDLMPKTFVFSTYGARGDLYPYLAIARELKGRGHRAIIATSEKYRREVESRGLEFHAVRPDSPDAAQAVKMMHPVSGTEFLFKGLLLPAIQDSIADLRTVIQNADVLVTHTTSIAGPMVAELEAPRGLKWASAIVSPLALLGEDVALPPLPLFADYPRLNRAVLFLVWRQLGMRMKETQQIRLKLGISRGDNAIWSDGHSPLLQLCLWDEKFSPIQGERVRKATGFCTLDDQSTLPTEVEEFLNAGKAPLLFVAASFAYSGQWVRESIAATEMLRQRCIVLGHDSLVIGKEDLLCPFLPLEALLPHVAAMVHFGGIGTFALGLKAGTPMLLTPTSHDQPDNARRARKLGLAHTMSTKNYRAASIANEVASLLGDQGLQGRLQSWRDEFQNGAHNAADELEKI
jgi:UDP:flavonoid glycosyltransferase YjiC (YdhE family)